MTTAREMAGADLALIPAFTTAPRFRARAGAPSRSIPSQPELES